MKRTRKKETAAELPVAPPPSDGNIRDMEADLDAPVPPDPTEELVVPDPTAADGGEERGDEEVEHTGLTADGVLEYRAPDETIWRCERANELCSDYRITGRAGAITAKFKEWHRVMSTAPDTWLIVRRYYAISPLMGASTVDDMRVWTTKEIAESAGVSPADIAALLKDTELFWNRSQVQGDLMHRMVTAAKPQMTSGEAGELLVRYGFADVTEPADRQYIVGRIADLGHILEMDEGRPIAISAIFQELMIRRTQKNLLMAMGGDTKYNFDKEQKRFSDLQSSYEETMKRIGATQEQNPGFRRKVAFNDCVGQITKAMQEYYRDGKTTLIDGLFTEAELVLLLTPTTLRPPQHRPDLAILSQEWRANIWNPNYVPTKIPRKQMTVLISAYDAAVRAAFGGDDTDMESDPLADDQTLEESALAELTDAIDNPANEGMEPGMDAGSGDEPTGIAPQRAAAASEYTPM